MAGFCSACGSQVPDDSRFCAECGAAFTPAVAPVNQVPQQAPVAAPVYAPAQPVYVPQPRRKLGPATILLIVILLAILGGVAFKVQQGVERKRKFQTVMTFVEAQRNGKTTVARGVLYDPKDRMGMADEENYDNEDYVNFNWTWSKGNPTATVDKYRMTLFVSPLDASVVMESYDDGSSAYKYPLIKQGGSWYIDGARMAEWQSEGE